MKKLILGLVALALALIAFLGFALPAAADAAFPPSKPKGWQGLELAYKCDPARYTPILSNDGTRVLYWNNPTCVMPGGKTDAKPRS